MDRKIAVNKDFSIMPWRNKMELTAAHLFSLVVTLLLCMAPGLYAVRHVRSVDDFSLGGRSAGVPIVSGTITGTIIGGAATLGTAQLAFCAGMSAWWFTLGSGIGLLLLAGFYAKPLRQSGLSTIPQFLVIHYGKPAGPLTSLASSLGIFFSIVASMLSGLSLLTTLIGVSPVSAALIMVACVCIYVFFGGIRGTGWSGLGKTGLLYFTLLFAGTTAYSGLGGSAGLQAVFPADPWLNLFGQGAGVVLTNAGSLIIGIISTQTYAQALFAARDNRTAMVGALVAAGLTIPVGFPSIMIGLYMQVHHPEILSLHALPLYLLTYVPPWIGGAALAALLLSVIGSIAGLALGIGAMFSGDIIRDLAGIRDGQTLLRMNRGTVFAVSFFAAVFVLNHLDTFVLDWNFLSMALRGTGIFVPLTLAVLCPGTIGSRTALVSMLVGLAAALACLLLFPGYGNPLLPGLGSSLAVIFLDGLLTQAARLGLIIQNYKS
jgi:SSS family solute:Na+ symporter